MTIKTTLTLEQLHDWILNAREVMYDEPHEDMAIPEEVELTGDPDDDRLAVEEVRTKFRQVLEAVNELDGLFHDKFDCR